MLRFSRSELGGGGTATGQLAEMVDEVEEKRVAMTGWMATAR